MSFMNLLRSKSNVLTVLILFYIGGLSSEHHHCHHPIRSVTGRSSRRTGTICIFAVYNTLDMDLFTIKVK